MGIALNDVPGFYASGCKSLARIRKLMLYDRIWIGVALILTFRYIFLHVLSFVICLVSSSCDHVYFYCSPGIWSGLHQPA